MNDEFVRKVCGLGTGEACCKFLTPGPAGAFSCGKSIIGMRDAIEGRGDMAAKGDNCGGLNRMRLVADDSPSGFKKGDIVYRYIGPTYGVVSPDGVVVTEESGRSPFYEVAKENLEEYPQEMPS